MNTFQPTIKGNYITYSVFMFFLINTLSLNAQVFPPDSNLTNVSYSTSSTLSGYLDTQTEENFGNNVTRVSDISVFGGLNISIRHAYAKRQVWNADQSYIMLAGNTPKILDGSTFDLVAAVSSFGNMGWSNTNRLMSYYTSASNNVFQKRMLNEANFTISTVFTKTFSSYNVMSHWGNECNVSADDKYVALYGTRSGSSMCWVVVYDIELDQVVSETNLNTPLSNVNWVSISQGGDFVLAQYNSIGSGSTQGTKSYDRNMNLISNLTTRNPHGDMGFDQFGNEVWVSNDQNQIRSKRLDGIGQEIQYAYVSGGHVSCRNINRPGWAYVNDHGASSSSGDYASFREVFAVKLDEKPGGQTTVQRFTKHYSNINPGYYHQPQAVASPDGSKVLFASNMDISSVESQSYPFAWVVEAPQTGSIHQVEASDDVSICESASTTLTAIGADSYVWMPGNIASDSIDVNPTTTTTYTVTGTHSDGSTTTDSVVVTVNPIPVANAGNDVEICQGESATLSASGGTSYSWSTGQTSQNITVNPNVTTPYTVQVFQNGCPSEADEVIVTVNPSPNTDAGSDVTINLGESTTLTASGADTYLWSTGETTQSITVSPIIETTYSVEGTIGACQNEDFVTVFLVGNEVVANAGNDQTICNGLETTLSATGGVAYVWNTGETTASINVSPTSNTTYTVTAFDATGTVSDTDDVIITVNPLPIVNAGIDVTITEGQSTTLTASGADTYQWSTGETTQSIEVTPTVDTIYTVTGFLNGCEATDDVFVNIETENIVANAGEDQTICEGESTTLIATGGTTYEWNTGETTQSIDVNPNTTTTYTVTAFNSAGTNSDTDDVLVTVNPLPIVNAGIDVTITEGQSTTLTASGADTYQWSTGETTQSIEVAPTVDTIYTVTGFLNGCEATDDVFVNIETENIVANAGEDQTICEGESTTLIATGGTTYEWSTGETTQSIDVNPNTTTTYTVTAFNTLGTNSDSDDVTVNVNPLPIVNAGIDVTITEGQSTTLTVSGADSYQWSTGETTQSIEVAPTVDTIYTVTGFINGCEATDDVFVNIETENIVANAGEDQTICEGESTTLIATGGVTYEWSTGETTASINVSPISNTTYTVTAFNTLGTNSDSDDVTVNVNPLPIVNAGIDVTITEGQSITLTASGADTYQWSTGETTQSIEVAPTVDTIYTVTGFINGCEATDDVFVNIETENIVANAGEDQTICEGESTTLIATGGVTYEWSTGETTQSIDVNPNTTTTYTVTAFNTLGTNSDSDDVIVNVNPLPIVNAGIDVTITEGQSTTLTASGADSYQWSTGETTQSIEVAPTVDTIYTVTGFINGCEATDDVFVNIETENIVANAGENQTICEGESTTLIATGGTTYEWSTGETTQSIDVNPNTTTTYTVTAFNTLGTNSDSDDVTVNVNPLPIVNAGIDVTITEGQSTTLTASGADSYQWSTGETTQSITVSPTSSTQYSVTGFLNGCEASDEVTVTVETENVNANAGADVTICEDGSTILTATGGTTYQWSTGETTPNIEVSPNVTTTYTVTVFNTLGTDSDTDEVIVTVNLLPTVDAGLDVSITEGETTTLTAAGADSYQWSTGETTQSIDVSPIVDTVYTVTGFLNGCEATDDVFVNVETENVIANAGNDQTICNGENITLTATGGVTYQWSTGETSASIDVNPTVTTTYTVTVFNTLGTNSDSDDVIVTVNDLPSVDAGIDVTITEGESTTLTATGANTYVWSTGETTQTIDVSPIVDTVYTVTGFLNGCEATDEVLVTVEPIIYTADAGEDQFICEGSSTTLTASEGDAYLWSTGETTQSIEVNPWASETFTVTVFEGDEQDDDDVTVFVNLNPNVVIMNGGEVTILEGEFITLSASGANTYEWNNGATQPNIAVSPTNSTTFSVTGYVNNCSDVNSVTVNVVETVEAYAGEDVFICTNETVTLTANGGSEYLWSTGETTQSINVTPGVDTEYSVLAYNALSSDEATVMVFVNDCDPIETPQVDQDFDVLIFQDATADVLKVQISGMNRVDVNQIVIYDLAGKVIYREQIQTNADTQSLDKEINSSQFSRGIYIVRLLYDDTELIKKIPIR